MQETADERRKTKPEQQEASGNVFLVKTQQSYINKVDWLFVRYEQKLDLRQSVISWLEGKLIPSNKNSLQNYLVTDAWIITVLQVFA